MLLSASWRGKLRSRRERWVWVEQRSWAPGSLGETQGSGGFCLQSFGRGPLLLQDSWLFSLGMGRPGLLAATSPSLDMGSRVFFPAFPWKGQFDLKGKSSPLKPQLGGGGGGGGQGATLEAQASEHREAVRVFETHVVMDGGTRVLGPQAVLATSQVGSLAGLAPSASRCVAM